MSMNDLPREKGKILQSLPTHITRDQSEWSAFVGSSIPRNPVLDRMWSNDFRQLVAAHPEAFARLVKRHREARRWSQRSLAKRCAVSYGAINDLETCKHLSATAHTIRELADTLSLTIDDLKAEIDADREEVAA